MNFSQVLHFTAAAVAIGLQRRQPGGSCAFSELLYLLWHLAVKQERADFRTDLRSVRHITSGAVMPKSANALARTYLVAATSRKRAARTGGSACTTGQAS
jgi:hypothetical protein